MIKVLFTIPNFDTAGSGKALLNIAKRLNKKKFLPIILCKHARGTFFKNVTESGLPVHVFDYETPMRPILKGLYGCRKVSRLISKINPDIIHSFHYSADYSEALASKLSGSKWVFTKKNMNWGGGSKNAWHLRSFLADGIIVQNTDMIKRFYPRSRKIKLIPRGVDTNQYSNEQNASDRIETNPNIILCVANLVPIKGVEILIEAYKKLITDSAIRKNWILKVVGEDNNKYGHYLKLQYQNLIDEKKIIFTGKINDVKSELSEAKIFVLPTLEKGRMEGSPVSLLEAMSMGLLVVGSQIPGIKDQLQPLGEKFLFKPGDSLDLAQKLLTLIQMNHQDRERLSEKISAYCRSSWNIETEVRRHEEFYLNILGYE